MAKDDGTYRKLALAFASVMQTVALSISGFAVGYFLDLKIERTKPWLTVIFTFIGLIGGFIRLYKLYIEMENE